MWKPNIKAILMTHDFSCLISKQFDKKMYSESLQIALNNILQSLHALL